MPNKIGLPNQEVDPERIRRCGDEGRVWQIRKLVGLGITDISTVPMQNEHPDRIRPGKPRSVTDIGLLQRQPSSEPRRCCSRGLPSNHRWQV